MSQGLIHSLDIFGTSPSLNINQKAKYQTSCGGLLTILLLIIGILIIINSSLDMFANRNPNVSLSEKILDKAGKTIPGPNKDINLAISLFNSTSVDSFIDNTIYHAQAFVSFLPKNKNEPLIPYPIDVEVCTAESAGILKEAIGKAWCIKTNTQNKDKLLISAFREGFLSFSLEFCVNTTSNPICRSQSELDQIIKVSYLAFHYTSLSIDPDNYKEPIKLKPDIHISGGMGFQTKGVRISLKEVEVVTEQSYFITKRETESKAAISTIQTESNQKFNNEFAAAYLFFSNRKTQYHRRYKSIEDVIAEVSGVLNAVFILFGIVFAPYLKQKYFENLIHTTFKIPKLNENDKNNDIDQNQSCNLSFQSPNLNPKTSIKKSDSQIQSSNSNHDMKRTNTGHLSQGNHTTANAEINFEPKKLNSQISLQIKNDDQAIVQGQQQPSSKQSSLYDDSLNEFQIQQGDCKSAQNYMFKVNKDKCSFQNPSSAQDNGGASSFRCKKRPNNKEQNRISFSFCQYMSSFLPCKSKLKQKKQLVYSGIQDLEEKLNIKNILQKIEEIEALKLCVFNDDQRFLFENLQKPILQIKNDSKKGKVKETQQEDKQLKIQDQCELIIQSIRQDANQTELDQNLLKLVCR